MPSGPDWCLRAGVSEEMRAEDNEDPSRRPHGCLLQMEIWNAELALSKERSNGSCNRSPYLLSYKSFPARHSAARFCSDILRSFPLNSIIVVIHTLNFSKCKKEEYHCLTHPLVG